MTIHFGIKTLSLAACLTFVGCMSTNVDQSAEQRAAQANSLKFINASSASLAQVAATPSEPKPDFAALGCPKLAKLVEDFQKYETQQGHGEFPQSFKDYLACFGLSPTPTQEEIAKIGDKLQDPQGLLDCLCGGDGFADSFDALKWQTFSANTSVTAGEVFQASNSSAAGAGYNGSSSTVSGTSYTGSQSTISGTPYSGK